MEASETENIPQGNMRKGSSTGGGKAGGARKGEVETVLIARASSRNSLTIKYNNYMLVIIN